KGDGETRFLRRRAAAYRTRARSCGYPLACNVVYFLDSVRPVNHAPLFFERPILALREIGRACPTSSSRKVCRRFPVQAPISRNPIPPLLPLMENRVNLDRRR